MAFVNVRKYFLNCFWFLAIFHLTGNSYAQMHCRSGELRCGIGGGWAEPANPPVVAPEEPKGPANLTSLIGRRCDDVQALSPAECKMTQDDAYAEGCISLEEKNWLYEKSYSILCAAGRPIFICPCSCFDRDVAIMTQDVEDPLWVPAAEITTHDRVTTLRDGVSLATIRGDKESFTQREIDYITSGPEAIDIYVIHLENGRELAVSEHHALMLHDGYMVTAKELKEDDFLLSYTGTSVAVLDIQRRPAKDGWVYNFLVKGSTAEAHLIIAEGVIVGDTMWQGSWSDRPGEVVLPIN
ncbi:MAG: Hint domain-containing protein [Oligoflexus sp.]